eukprot:1457031-Alexandrium_andersonii.AAC.1
MCIRDRPWSAPESSGELRRAPESSLEGSGGLRRAPESCGEPPISFRRAPEGSSELPKRHRGASGEHPESRLDVAAWDPAGGSQDHRPAILA